MNTSLGRITATLAEPSEQLTPELMGLLNDNISPPAPLAETDVCIRAMYIVSDEINSYGGRFPVEEHDHLGNLLVDSPVLVGHRKDKLPIKRTFHAVPVERDGRSWVKSYFYWLKNAEGARTLQENIDGGIYKECSVGFTFRFPECSVCGKDIRLCPHEPLQTYAVDGAERICHFNYRQIERVLETSLVYRGAIPDTSVSRDLARIEPDAHRVERLVPIDSPDELDEDRHYVVCPRYEAVAVEVSVDGGRLALRRLDGGRLDESIADGFSPEGLPDGYRGEGKLVGYRGKSRCSLEQLEAGLAEVDSGGSAPGLRQASYSRLVLLLMPSADEPQLPRASKDARYAVNLMPYRRATTRDLNHQARQLATSEGVEVYLADGTSPGEGYAYIPPVNEPVRHREYSLAACREDGSAVLSLTNGEQTFRVVLHRFDRQLLEEGRRFIADLADSPTEVSASTDRGGITRLVNRRGALLISLTGGLAGQFVLRPISHKNRRRFVFYRRNAAGMARHDHAVSRSHQMGGRANE